MYWEYQRPTRKLFIADGKQTFFYVPDDNQVWISELDVETTATPLLFLLGLRKIRDDFQVQFEAGEEPLNESNVLLRLTPIRMRPELSHVLVEVSPATFLIRRLTIVEPIGNRNDYIFRRFRENIKVRDKKFRLELPDGVEIIRMGYGIRSVPEEESGRRSHRSRLDSGSETPGEKGRVPS
jgi:outer membrane lipoprotein-sorting protein